MRYLIGIGNYSGWDDSIGLRVIEAVAAAIGFFGRAACE